MPLLGSLTYPTLGQLMTTAILLFAAFLVALRSAKGAERGGYLPGIALGSTGFLMLLTGIGSPHFLLALPFILLCRKWLNGVAYYSIVGVWTVTTLVPMYGILAVDLAT